MLLKGRSILIILINHWSRLPPSKAHTNTKLDQERHLLLFLASSLRSGILHLVKN